MSGELKKDIPRIIGKYSSEKKGPLLFVTAGIHGNEPSGVKALMTVFEELEKTRKRLLCLGCKPTPKSMVVDLMSKGTVEEEEIGKWIELLRQRHAADVEFGKWQKAAIEECYGDIGLPLCEDMVDTDYKNCIYPILVFLLSDERIGVNRERALSLADRITSLHQGENDLDISLRCEIRNLPTYILEYIWGKYIENAAIDAGLYETIYGDIEWKKAGDRLADQVAERGVHDQADGSFKQHLLRGSLEINEINRVKREAFLSFMHDYHLRKKSNPKEQEGQVADGSRRDKQTGTGHDEEEKNPEYDMDRLVRSLCPWLKY